MRSGACLSCGVLILWVHINVAGVNERKYCSSSGCRQYSTCLTAQRRTLPVTGEMQPSSPSAPLQLSHPFLARGPRTAVLRLLSTLGRSHLAASHGVPFGTGQYSEGITSVL